MNRFLARLTFGPAPLLTSVAPPVTSAGVQVFFRGYVGNAEALAAEARRRGHDGAHASPADTLALAYQWWGADLSRHVLGEYAVAVYDAARGVLLLTHDELGLVPLFYSEQAGQVYFASYLEDLVDELGVGELDEEYIADYLAEGRHFGGLTPFRHIRRLPPGQSLLFSSGGVERRDTWTVADVRPLRYRDDRDYECHFRELVSEAVTSAVPERGKVWCELSGGLDSSTVLSLASGAASGRLEATSFLFPRSHTADESRWMRAVLEKHPVPWRTLDGDSVRPFTELPESFIAEPSFWFVSYGANRIYAELLREHDVPAVLTGQGGDAVLFGDGAAPYFFADLLRAGRLGRLWKQAHYWQRGSRDKRPVGYWLSRYALAPAWRYLRKGVVQEYPYHSRPAPWLNPGYARANGLAHRGRRSYVPRAASVAHSYFLERVMGVAVPLASHYYHERTGSQFRHPLFYRPLLEFMLALPPNQQLTPTRDRPLQRRSLAGVLPEATLLREDKAGSDQAFYEGLESGSEWFTLLTDRPRVAARGYVDQAAWRQAVLQAQVGRTVGLRYFVATANLEAWLRQLEAFRPSKPLAAGSRQVAATPQHA